MTNVIITDTIGDLGTATSVSTDDTIDPDIPISWISPDRAARTSVSATARTNVPGNTSPDWN